MNLSNYKRAWMITDTHLGVRNSSVEWMDIMKEYFRDFFIPLLKKEKKEGDFLIHLGDVFDSRQSLNLQVMNDGMDIFEEISKIMPIVIILGNHDIYKKNSNEVNSVKVLKWIPNITVLEEPQILRISGKKLLMMPWRANHHEEEACINEHPADFLFCHTDVQGLKFNKHTEIHEGMDFSVLDSFRKVYSGHIHYAQHKRNFRMLGSPYPLTRSDVNNEKGIWCFNIEDETEHFYPNTCSPKFMRIQFERILDMEEEAAKQLVKNNFVDVIVDQKWSLNFPFATFYDDVQGYRKLEFVPRIGNTEDEDGFDIDVDGENELGKVDIIELANKLIQSTSHSDTLKKKLLETIKMAHEKLQKSKEEQEDED